MRYNLKTKKYFALIFFLFTLFFVGFFSSRYQLPKNPNTQKKNEDIIFNWNYSPKIISIETPLILTFALDDKNGKSISKAYIEVEATMNHSGMVPIKTFANYTPSQKRYETKLNLNMQGRWIVFLSITLENKQVIKKTISFVTE